MEETKERHRVIVAELPEGVEAIVTPEAVIVPKAAETQLSAKASVWRRPRIQKLALSATREDLGLLRAVAGWLWPGEKTPTQSVTCWPSI